MEKPFVKIIFLEGRLRCKNSNTEEMFILGFFLATDVGCYGSGFKKWIMEAGDESTLSNITFVDKESNYVYLSDLYSEQEDGGPYLKIHRDELIKILDAWEQFCKTKPKEIIITQEDDSTFKIEAKD